MQKYIPIPVAKDMKVRIEIIYLFFEFLVVFYLYVDILILIVFFLLLEENLYTTSAH